MVSAAGSGELLFTPRVGALYGYALLWALCTAVVLKWFINREVGRFTVCTGATVLEGFRHLPGPRNWAVGLILVPQLVVAVATIAGLAGAAATALIPCCRATSVSG
ncbi:MAG: Nramp family divalent metal transporter [Candidatus Binatia bacterium]